MPRNDLIITAPNKLILSGGSYNASLVDSNGLAYNQHMTIDSSGNVGINAEPILGTKLHVDGNITFSGTSASSSDDRLKENETLITNALDTICKLRPEIYDKKPTFNNTNTDTWYKETGLIAQEVWYKTPELRHLVSLGLNIVEEPDVEQIKYNVGDTTGLVKSFFIESLTDDSGNIINSENIYKLTDTGEIFIDDKGHTHIDPNNFLLLDDAGEQVIYNDRFALDYNKLMAKNISGIPFTYTADVQHEKLRDSDGNLILDASGETINRTETKIALDTNGNPLIDISGTLVINKEVINVIETEFYDRPLTRPSVNKIVTNVKPEDIQDTTLTDDIQNDPDYNALGWGDTPAKLNYNGLIPYLIKSIQEQKETIDTLKSEVDTLKNA